MPILRPRTDLPLGDDPSSRFLAWITALMCYLAVLSLAGFLAVSTLAGRWNQSISGGLTVQIAPIEGAGAPTVEARTAIVLDRLRSHSGVRAAEPVPAEETARLLEPWLGPEANVGTQLPIPALIDVTVDTGFDSAGLIAEITGSVRGVTIDDHGNWLAELRGFAHMAEAMAIAVVLVVGGVGLMAVGFAVRAGLAIHHRVVRLLHLMGATDAYVARQFERHVLSRSLIGALTGTMLALATLGGFSVFSGISPLALFALWQWAVFGMVPAAAIGLAVLTARLSVLNALERLP